MTASETLEERPSEELATPKKDLNLEVDNEPEVKCDVNNDSPSEGKKTKKKDVKKDKGIHKTGTSNFWAVHGL